MDLFSEVVVLLYVFWSLINYSDWYINELSNPNPKIYYTNSGALMINGTILMVISNKCVTY